MQITLPRVQQDSDVTIGEMRVNGVHECWVCEDPVREVEGQPVATWKIKGKTAIPRGNYKIIITFSQRFQRDLPLLVDVPGFEGIRIHPGNTPANTEGCLLPGVVRLSKSVGQSKDAFNALFAKIRVAKIKGEPVTIEIT